MAPRFFFGPAKWFQPEQGLTAHEKLVLAVLCQWTSSDSGECFPSIATIAAHSSLCENSVRKAIAGLVENGAVTLRQRRTESGKQMSTVYLIMGYDPPKTGVHPVKGRGASRGTRGVHRVNPNVVSTNNPLDNGDFVRTDKDGTVWLGNTPYRSR